VRVVLFFIHHVFFPMGFHDKVLMRQHEAYYRSCMVMASKWECYKSWSGLPLTRPGPRPAQYLEDGETAEALERGEREPTSGERERRPQSLEKRKPFPFPSRCNLSIIMY